MISLKMYLKEGEGHVLRLQYDIRQKLKLIEVLNPEKVLKQGYAILSGKVSPGSVVKITTFDKEINAEVKDIHDRK